MRSGLVIDGRRVVDPYDVLWLQTESWFGDVRVPIEHDWPESRAPQDQFRVSSVFVGSDADIDADTITWHPVRPDLGSGTYRYRRTGALIVELGVSEYGGQEYEWAEEWVRITAAGAPTEVYEESDRVRLTVGDFRFVGGTSDPGAWGQIQILEGDQWIVRSSVGDVPA